MVGKFTSFSFVEGSIPHAPGTVDGHLLAGRTAGLTWWSSQEEALCDIPCASAAEGEAQISYGKRQGECEHQSGRFPGGNQPQPRSTSFMAAYFLITSSGKPPSLQAVNLTGKGITP